MELENVFEPELGLIETDEFYLFYEMMTQSLKTDNVKEGLNVSLSLLRRFLKSGNIFLYKLNANGRYVCRTADTSNSNLNQTVSSFVNRTKHLIEQKKMFYLELELSDELQNMMMLHTKLKDTDCVLTVLNIDNNRQLEPKFWERVRETMHIILKRAASYERNIMAVNTDLLTGLDNRNSYETRLQSLGDEDFVLGIFDLFRLKYVNDNYTHNEGDIYIKEIAKILNKYWPKNKVRVNENGVETFIETGHCVYRVGGDEFVLLTSVDNLHYAEIKAQLAAAEAELVDLGVGGVKVGLNYGVVRRNPGETIRETLARADEIMQENKRMMYMNSGLDRRR